MRKRQLRTKPRTTAISGKLSVAGLVALISSGCAAPSLLSGLSPADVQSTAALDQDQTKPDDAVENAKSRVAQAEQMDVATAIPTWTPVDSQIQLAAHVDADASIDDVPAVDVAPTRLAELLKSPSDKISVDTLADHLVSAADVETLMPQVIETEMGLDELVSIESEGFVGEHPEEFASAAVNSQVIDLASSLGMAGGNAWSVQLARQRTVEAHADVTGAKALWLPSLQMGVGWNNHGGRIQATNGDVIEASRSSLFFGGGATLGTAPVAGGSGGPLRLTADLALADAYFETKIAERNLEARRHGVSVARNRAVLDAGMAYVDLLESTAQVADAQAAIDAATELFRLTETFQQAGAGAQADVDRAATEQARLQQQWQDAQRLARTRAATLARLVRIDPRTILQPADPVMMPLELSADESDVDALVAIAMTRRPEIAELLQQNAALCLAVKKAQIEPWIPLVTMATSAGTFGGGHGSDIDLVGSRSDVDLQALWQLDSLGVGVRARRQRAASRLEQGRFQLADIRDEIMAEVVRAQEDLRSFRSQITSAESAMSLAEMSYQRNLTRVRADEGLPIELLQAINALAAGLSQRTTAVAGYNRAQLRLLYATGQLMP